MVSASVSALYIQNRRQSRTLAISMAARAHPVREVATRFVFAPHPQVKSQGVPIKGQREFF